MAAAIVLFLAVLCFFLPYYLFLPAYSLPAREEGELRVHFLGGAGDCTVIEFPGGNVLLINAGDGTLASKNAIYRFVRGLSPTSVSVLATDADKRCVGGFGRILQSFPVERAYLPAFPKARGAYARFSALLKQKKVLSQTLTRYQSIADGSGAYAVCLSPYSIEESADEASVVLWLSYQGVNFLMAGNCSAARQQRFYKEYQIDPSIFSAGEYEVRLNETHVVRVAEHGAAGSVSGELLGILNASVALVQCGNGYSLSESTARLLAGQGLDVYRTDELDTVTVSVKDGNFRVLPHFGNVR